MRVCPSSVQLGSSALFWHDQALGSGWPPRSEKIMKSHLTITSHRTVTTLPPAIPYCSQTTTCKAPNLKTTSLYPVSSPQFSPFLDLGYSTRDTYTEFKQLNLKSRHETLLKHHLVTIPHITSHMFNFSSSFSVTSIPDLTNRVLPKPPPHYSQLTLYPGVPN
jgi:hypothetical protein